MEPENIRKRSIVEAVKAAHEFGGDGSSWRLYAPHSGALHRQREYNAAWHDSYIMKNKNVRNAAMSISTFGGEG